jgi:hypothetical protein
MLRNLLCGVGGHRPWQRLDWRSHELVAAIGASAAPQREKGAPLYFPGGSRYVHACSEGRLIAWEVQFAGRDPGAAIQTFDAVDGDALTWQDAWAPMARHLGLQPDVQPDRAVPSRFHDCVDTEDAILHSLTRMRAVRPFS